MTGSTTRPAPDLGVIILTHNEARHIERAIASVAPIARRIFVVDSGSTDRTVALAEAAGAQVALHPFENYARQFQWALDTLPIDTAWVMRLDADEVIEPDLAAALAHELPRLAPDVAGVNLKRKHIFLGRWIKRGGRYPLVLLRIWRRGQGRIEDRWMDEHMIVRGGRSITLEGGFADHNLNDIGFFTDKHNRYATREAIDVLAERHGLFARDDALLRADSPSQASLKRWAKERLYNRLPFQLNALVYFLYRYIVQLGFLDGRAGLIYHVLQGFWYRFLVGAKLLELEMLIEGMSDPAAIRAKLSEATGLDLIGPGQLCASPSSGASTGIAPGSALGS